MLALITKEIKDFWSNGLGVFSLAVLIVLSFLFLWVFPDSSYPTYGLAEADLYFQFLSYLLLFVVPAFSVGFLSNEYRYGTEELLRSLGVNWITAISSKFFAALSILIFLILLTSIHLFIIIHLSINDQPINYIQIVGSYSGLIGFGACYIGISLMITSFIEQTTASYIFSVFVCFMLFSGIRLISEIPLFSGGYDFWLESLSLSFHADQIARGILRLSTVIYILLIVTWSLWVAAHRLNTKEV